MNTYNKIKDNEICDISSHMTCDPKDKNILKIIKKGDNLEDIISNGEKILVIDNKYILPENKIDNLVKSIRYVTSSEIIELSNSEYIEVMKRIEEEIKILDKKDKLHSSYRDLIDVKIINENKEGDKAIQIIPKTDFHRLKPEMDYLGYRHYTQTRINRDSEAISKNRVLKYPGKKFLQDQMGGKFPICVFRIGIPGYYVTTTVDFYQDTVEKVSEQLKKIYGNDLELNIHIVRT